MEKTNKPVTLWTKNFIAISIINLLIFCSFQMLLPTLPVYVKSLGCSDSFIGWIAAVSTISALIIRPFSGIALDKFGRKVVFLTGIFIVLIVTFAYGWISIVGIVLAIRFLHGFGWGIASTASNTIASDIIPKKRFGEGMGFFSLSSSLAMALAPAVSLYFLNVSSFRNVAILSGGLCILALILSFFIKYSNVEKGDGKGRMVLYEKASIAPSLVMFFVTASYGAIVGFISLYALEQGIHNIGIFFTIYAASLLITRPFFGKIIDNFGLNTVIYPGLIILVISMILLSYASSMPYFLISAFLYGIGFGAVQSSLQTMAILKAPKARFGAANATFFTGFDGGIGFGSVIAGMVASAIGYSRMYFFFSIFLITAIVLYFIISKTEKLKSIN